MKHLEGARIPPTSSGATTVPERVLRMSAAAAPSGGRRRGWGDPRPDIRRPCRRARLFPSASGTAGGSPPSRAAGEATRMRRVLDELEPVTETEWLQTRDLTSGSHPRSERPRRVASRGTPAGTGVGPASRRSSRVRNPKPRGRSVLETREVVEVAPVRNRRLIPRGSSVRTSSAIASDTHETASALRVTGRASCSFAACRARVGRSVGAAVLIGDERVAQVGETARSRRRLDGGSAE